jgi:excisionase family DNA binding protein
VQVPDSAEAMPALVVRPEEAARMLRISRTEVYRLIGSGEIASILIGRRRRIPVAALNQYVAARVADGCGPPGELQNQVKGAEGSSGETSGR